MAESDNAVKQYEVYYKEISENATTIDIFGNNENVNVTRKATTAVVDGLQKGKKHQFFVIARNQGSLRPDQTSSPFFTPSSGRTPYQPHFLSLFIQQSQGFVMLFCGY